MPTIETATGPVDSAELGRVLMHEHVFIISPEMKDNVPEDWGDDDERLDDAVRRLNELKAAGIDAILDPTALGLGRYIPRIAELAGRIDLQASSSPPACTRSTSCPTTGRGGSRAAGPTAATRW